MKKLLILVTVVLMLCGVSCAQREGLDVGEKAPDFTLPDISGKDVKLSDAVAANKSTLLVFWTTWCPSCRHEIPELIKMDAGYKSKGLGVVSVNIGESPKKVKSFATQEGIRYTVLIDESNRVADQYGIRSIPSNILIDSDGVIKYRGTQLPPEEMLVEE